MSNSINRIRGSKFLKIIIGASIAGIFVFIFAISAIISLKLNLEFYANRLNMNWWTIFTMDWAAILWCPIVTIIILAIVVSVLNPTTSTTLTLISSAINKGYRRPTRIKCIVWNYIVIVGIGGLVMGWFIGFMTNAAFGIFVAKNAGLSINFSTITQALSYPLQAGVADMDVVFTFSFIIRPFLILITLVIIMKLGLDLVISFGLRKKRGTNPLKVSGSVVLIISMIFLIGWFYLPSGAFDYVDVIATKAVIFGFWISLGLGLILYILGIVNPPRFRGDKFYKVLILSSIIILAIVPTIFLISAGWNSLYRQANWEPWVWDTKIETQINKTRTAAGLNGFRELTTQQLMANQSLSGTTDEEVIPHIRTIDFEASRASMENKIGSNWESLADSDIIFINGSEYWVAPRTIDPESEDWGWVQDHLIYTHSRGFVALNPTGDGDTIPEASYPNVFGVPYNYSIYFGELPDNSFTMLNQTEQEIENIRYPGAPDVSLSGFLNWWYIDEWGYKTAKESNYLIKRNIYDRVGGILLPYMIIGDDPYLIFHDNRLYYCLDIILDFPSFSGYIQSDIVRWLGVVLVDTQLGSMNFYYYNGTYNNLPYDYLDLYYTIYPWTVMPDWLPTQLKYPEILAEYQLEVDYTYHVTNPNIWRSANDFFERPAATDLHHIMYDVGYGLTYVSASFVEFLGSDVGNLVGFYIIENGVYASVIDNSFGRFTFYRNGTAGETLMIGLTAARSAYEQKDATYLQLLPNKRFGNYLIYPLADSLYFVIPVYDTSGQHKQTLKRVALVNAFNPNDIAIGNSTLEAYDALNVTTHIPEGVLSLNIIRAPPLSKENVYETPTNNLEILVNNDYIYKTFNVSLYIRTETDLFNVSFGGQELVPDTSGGNYTYNIANFTLLPTQYTGVTPQITGRLPTGFPSGTINYYIELYFQNGTIYDSIRRSIYIYQ
ncbi:MAG: UPF0182 family protein [Candidatus Helarchaeota archaeon]